MAKSWKNASPQEKLEMVADQDPSINLVIPAAERTKCQMIALGFLAVIHAMNPQEKKSSSKKASSKDE